MTFQRKNFLKKGFKVSHTYFKPKRQLLKKIQISKILDPSLWFHKFFVKDVVTFSCSLFIEEASCLWEIFDFYMLKVVQVANSLIEQALSFSRLNLGWCVCKTISSWAAKSPSPGGMLFVHQVWEINDFSSILTWFWQSIPNICPFCLGLRQKFIPTKFLPWCKNLGSLFPFLLFWEPLEGGSF